jgi:hypothetical protein
MDWAVLYGERVMGFEIREACTADKESLTKGIWATRVMMVNSGEEGADWVSVAIVDKERLVSGWLAGSRLLLFERDPGMYPLSCDFLSRT